MMRVAFVLRYDAGLYMGGGEIRALRTKRALEEVGVDVRVHSPLDRADDVDVVHFFGGLDYFAEIAERLDERGVPYVCSPIWMGDAGVKHRVRAIRRRLFDRHRYRNLRRLIQGAEAVVVLSDAERARIETYFGLAGLNYRVVPNGVDPLPEPDGGTAFRGATGLRRPYLLHVGRFEPRKNQRILLEAAKGLDYALAFVGQSHDENYLRGLREAAPADAVFLTDLPARDPVLMSAYAGASAFVLPSASEGLSTSALEAGVAGLPIVLSNTWGAEEHFGRFAKYVSPDDPASIRRAIVEAIAQHDREATEAHFRAFAWPRIAEQLRTIYEGALTRR